MSKIRKGNPHRDQMDAEISRLDKLAQTSPFRIWREKGVGAKRKKWWGGKEKALKKFSKSRPSYYKDK